MRPSLKTISKGRDVARRAQFVAVGWFGVTTPMIL